MLNVNSTDSFNHMNNVYSNFYIKNKEQIAQNTKTETKKDKHGMSTTSKLMIGMGAIAAVAISGILMHKAIKIKQANELMETFQKENEVLLQRINAAAKPSETAGKTIEESIQNVFGPNSIVKPHTYDKSKETVMCFMENRGGCRGFCSANLTPDNKIIDEVLLNDAGEVVGKSYSCYPAITTSGVTKEGERYVTFNFPSYMTTSSGDSVANAITILSKNGELTPVQQDLLKIIERHRNGNLTKEELNLFRDITARYPRSDKYSPYTFMGNYDSVLSLIQTLASKC